MVIFRHYFGKNGQNLRVLGHKFVLAARGAKTAKNDSKNGEKSTFSGQTVKNHSTFTWTDDQFLPKTRILRSKTEPFYPGRWPKGAKNDRKMDENRPFFGHFLDHFWPEVQKQRVLTLEIDHF